MSISIIIPIKNEEDVILETLKKLEESWIVQVDHEILIINDYSTDKSVELIKNENFKKLKVILLDNPNVGLGSAIKCGIDNSSNEFINIYMADMSDSIGDLKTYYEKIKDNKSLDAIFGSRFVKDSKVMNYPKIKLLLNRLANNLI